VNQYFEFKATERHPINKEEKTSSLTSEDKFERDELKTYTCRNGIAIEFCARFRNNSW